jgi:formylmethanofuran dehydrogenase subunit C
MFILRRTDENVGLVDGAVIRPDQFVGRTVDEIGALPISTGSELIELRRIFSVQHVSSLSPDSILIEGNCSSVENLGQEMASGWMCVHGDVGYAAGRGLRGGSLLVVGNASDRAGMGMKDGLLFVTGNCGVGLVAPEPGNKAGMRGGDVFVMGHVGERACERMRRGTVFVGGSMASFAATQMIAGTIVVMGSLGDHWGLGMRRGSLILGQDPAGQPRALLSQARTFELSFLPLIWHHLDLLQATALQELNHAMVQFGSATQTSQPVAIPSCMIPKTRWAQRQIADLSYQGRGEVLVLKRISSI